MRENLVRLREAETPRLTTQALAARLAAYGRPIRADGITKIEAGQRHVDVDDLVALAVALDVSPLALLLPHEADDEQTELTRTVTTTALAAWRWAEGDQPLLGGPQHGADEQGVVSLKRKRRFRAESAPQRPVTSLDRLDEAGWKALGAVARATTAAIAAGLTIGDVVAYAQSVGMAPDEKVTLLPPPDMDTPPEQDQRLLLLPETETDRG